LAIIIKKRQKNKMDSINFLKDQKETDTILYKREIETLQLKLKKLEEQSEHIKFQNIQLGDRIINLEKENSDLRLSVSSNNRTDKSFKSLQDQNELLEREKIKLQDEIRHQRKLFQMEKEQIIKQNEESIFKLKNVIETNSSKIENAIALERLLHIQAKDITQLETELKVNERDYELKSERKKLKTEMKFSDLKKKMTEHIEKTQKNVEQMNLSHMDISTKLTLLQNHQLLMELEYQSQQVEELLKKKEMNEKRIFQLERDIEIHNEVELVLAEKNRKYLEVLKNLTNDKDKSEPDSNISINHNYNNNLKNNIPINTHHSNFYSNTNPNTNPQTDENFFINVQTIKNSLYLNNNDNSITRSKILPKDQNVIKLEKKVHSLEKMIEKRKSEYTVLKTNYEIIQEKLINYERKYTNLFNLFQEGLDRLSEDESLRNSSELCLNVEKIKNADFSKLSSEKKYAILLILMKNILPIINPSDMQTSEASKVNFQQVKVKYQLSKAINNDNIFKRITGPSGSLSVTHKQKFSADLPSIKKIIDPRFKIPNKLSVLY
jgi:hypothetical protein